MLNSSKFGEKTGKSYDPGQETQRVGCLPIEGQEKPEKMKYFLNYNFDFYRTG